VAYAAAVFVLWALATKRTWSGRAAWNLLALFWLWNGLAYHGLYFARINKAAYGFAALFILQGMMFLAHAFRHKSAPSSERLGWRSAVAVMLIIYAAVVYGVLGTVLGHGWPGAPVFGVAPCPTTIFTFALLILLRAPMWLAVVPLLWAAIGSTASVLLDVTEDLGLLASALLYLITIVPERARRSPEVSRSI